MRRDTEARLMVVLFTLCVFLLGGVAGWILRMIFVK